MENKFPINHAPRLTQNTFYRLLKFTRIMKVEDLTIKVTYKVGLGDVEMPKEVYEQLLLASEKRHEIDPTMMKEEYREAADWLLDNIKEADSIDWVAEVDEISEHDVED